MRLFGYIAVFASDIRDDERTNWHSTLSGRGGPHCEAHARWGRGGLTVAARHYCGPIGGRGDPCPIGACYRVPARGRGCSSCAAGPPIVAPLEEEVLQGPPCHGPVGSPVAVPLEGRGCLVTVDDNGPDDEGPVLPLVSSSLFIFFSKM
jgi:hypothetical protein